MGGQPKKKLPPSCGASDLHLNAEIRESANESLRQFGAVPRVEVGPRQFSIGYPIAQDVVRGGEHRGGHGDDGLHRPAPALEAEELRAEVSWTIGIVRFTFAASRRYFAEGPKTRSASV